MLRGIHIVVYQELLSYVLQTIFTQRVSFQQVSKLRFRCGILCFDFQNSDPTFSLLQLWR